MTNQNKDVEEPKDQEKEAEPKKRAPRASHHSLDELMQVAIDMGDQRVIDAVKKMIEE
jgi:hypothetical protein